MTNKELIEKAEQLWNFFEEKIFINDGNFSYSTNLVFAFADYIDNISDEDLQDFLQCDDQETLINFKKIISRAIDKWLQDFSKTMAIM
ncbi:MAG: hypothetical protein J6T72_04105 [Alphaproteobacteria bacterium]|nr:hypothetical protein [Alphaproteobacteria bacterium]